MYKYLGFKIQYMYQIYKLSTENKGNIAYITTL